MAVISLPLAKSIQNFRVVQQGVSNFNYSTVGPMSCGVEKLNCLCHTLRLAADQVGHGHATPLASPAAHQQFIFPLGELQPLLDEVWSRHLFTCLGLLDVVEV